jgi:DNA-binding transcriptional LysR family regulator
MICSMSDKATPPPAPRAAPPARPAAAEPAAGLDDFGALRTFARVVELESFSKAARQMGVTPSTVSKQISALEAQLRTRLVNRTTRQLVITDAGERLYQRFLRVAEELREAQEELSSMQAEPMGHLRVSLPLALGARCIAPHIPAFLKRFPALSLDLDLSVAKVDLLADHFDVAVRIADALGDGLVAIRLAPYERVFCAAPSYLAERGTPLHPDDLGAHECLVAVGARTERTWPVAEGERIRHIAVSGRFMVNHGDALHEATLAGLGIGMQPRWRVAEALRQGLLTEILPQFAVQRRSIWAVLAQRGAMSPKVRVFVEFLQATLAELDRPQARETGLRPA